MGGIDMKTKIEKEIIEDLKSRDFKDFIEYLGIDPEDMEYLYPDIDFDDVSV